MTVRRHFLIALAGSALAAPLAPLAQQPVRARRIGILWDADPSLKSQMVDAFRAGLRELGYVEGKDYVIDDKTAKGDLRRLPTFVAELLALKVDLILATSGPSALAAREASRDVPIVITGDPDPVGSGLAASLARPGGNVTGLTNQNAELAIKQLDLLREIVPRLRRVGLLQLEGRFVTLTGVERECSKLKIQCIRAAVREQQDIPGAFGVLQRDKAQGLIVGGSGVLVVWRHTIIEQAARHRLPAIYGNNRAADEGGLITYFSNVLDRFGRAATYADKIFKGAKPGDLPIEQPTKFELVVNIKTARALGIAIPQSILVRADRVIE